MRLAEGTRVDIVVDQPGGLPPAAHAVVAAIWRAAAVTQGSSGAAGAGLALGMVRAWSACG